MLRTIIIKRLSLVAFFTATSATAATHEYVVTVAEDLRQIQVVARFGTAVKDVSARSRSAGDFLISAHDCDRDIALPIAPRLVVPNDGLRCLAYRVDLEKAARLNRRYDQSDANTLIVQIPLWMWRPRLGGTDEVIVSFELPDDVNVSVPWRPLADRDHSFRLESSPQSGSAIAIFGEFAAETVHVADADLRIVSVPSRANPINPEIVDWIRKTAEHITLAYGRFPNPHARVLLLPVANRRAESAVQFGRVVRDGGETIELMVDPTRPEESFLGDWTATHEFSHLMLPYIDRGERWISEGFAQYYQKFCSPVPGVTRNSSRGRSSMMDSSP